MVGENGESDVDRVLDDEQLKQIVEKALGAGWEVRASEERAAGEGLLGFLGEHRRAAVAAGGARGAATLRLFVKTLPRANPAKADFIVANNFFRRERLMYQLFEELGGDEGANPWRPKAYLCTDSVVVLADAAAAGYAPRPRLSTLDARGARLAAAAVARLHAAFERRRAAACRLLRDHPRVMEETTLCDSPWLRAAARLSATLLDRFSDAYRTIPDLEAKLHAAYLEACDSLKEYADTLNVVIHRDLWINNIMFSEDNAILVDYQCVRYAPPAFDLMILLYLTTTREFREAHEKEVISHYYEIFTQSLDPASEQRVRETGYDREELFRWCERGRMFGLFLSVGIFPYVLMEGRAAAAAFDEPASFAELTERDRAAPVLRHAAASPAYLRRQLDATEEFVQRYVLNKDQLRLC